MVRGSLCKICAPWNYMGFAHLESTSMNLQLEWSPLGLFGAFLIKIFGNKLIERAWQVILFNNDDSIYLIVCKYT